MAREIAMFPSLSKAFRSAPLELGKYRCVPFIVSRSRAERRTVKEYIVREDIAMYKCNVQCCTHVPFRSFSLSKLKT